MKLLHTSLIFLFAIPFFHCAPIAKDEVKDDFEGRITYLTTMESKTSKITTEQLQRNFGDTMVMYIKTGNCLMKCDGSDIQAIYILKEENTEYDIRKGIDSVFVGSLDSDPRRLLDIKNEPSDDLVAGRKCHKITFRIEETNGKISINHFWYDPSIYSNPKNYSRQKLSFMNQYYAQSKSPYLKFQRIGRAFNTTYTAIEISPMALDDSIFKVPDLPHTRYPD